MSEISPRPWKVDRDNNSLIVDVNGAYVFNVEYLNVEDMAYMLKAVNEHDSLVAAKEKSEAEVARLLKLITDAQVCIYPNTEFNCGDNGCENCLRELIKERDGERE